MLKLIFLRCAACEACARQRAILDKVKPAAPPDVEFREIDTSVNADAASHYDVKGHPTIVVERDGKELKRWTGVADEEEILATLMELAGREAARPVELRSGPAVPPGGRVPGSVAPPPERLPPPAPEHGPPIEPPGPR
jgi:thioredoxin 1